MKKMCPWYKRAACSVDSLDYNYEKYKYVRHDCPKNVNDKCEIIPRKPKMVKVKARCRFNALQGMWADTWNTEGIPCTILIDRKYLKGAK
jgi:hypothetical protein